MKKTVSILVIIAMLLASIVAILPIIATEAEPGTPEEVVTEGIAIESMEGILPYVLEPELTKDKVFYLTKDIESIGFPEFYGKFYGNGYTFKTSGQAFGTMDGATVQDLKIEGVGAVIGAMKNESVIKNVTIKMSESGSAIKSMENATAEDLKITLAAGEPVFGSSVVGSTIKNVEIAVSGVKEISSSMSFGGLANTVKDSRIDTLSLEYAIKVKPTADYEGNIGGLFATAEGTCVFENITRSGDILMHTWDIHEGVKDAFMGGMVAITGQAADLTFKNCVNNGDVGSTRTMTNVGGILGKCLNAFVSFDNCSNSGDLMTMCENSAGHLGIGGILGATENRQYDNSNPYTIFISNCENTGDIFEAPTDLIKEARAAIKGDATLSDAEKKAEKGADCVHAGGIVGRAFGIPHLSLNTCVNKGNITFTNQGSDWSGSGGIVGHLMTIGDWEGVLHCNVSAVNCLNEGNVSGSAPGGIFGGYNKQLKLSGTVLTVEYCVNKGNITGRGNRCAGGIFCNFDAESKYGAVVSHLTVKNCANYGDVSGATYAGGIVATMNNPEAKAGTPQFINCYNEGDITTVSYTYKKDGKDVTNQDMAGGIAANITVKSNLTNCINAGKVTTQAAGKAAPIVSNDTSAVTVTDCIYASGSASGEFKHGVSKSASEVSTKATAIPYQKNNNNLALEDAIAVASKLVSSDYTAASWKAVADALAAGKTASADVTKSQDVIDAAEATLETAVANLVANVANYAKLDEAIAEYNKLKESDWSSLTWLNLKEAVEAGKALKEFDTTLQSEADEATTNIKTAISKLEKRAASTTLPIFSDIDGWINGDLVKPTTAPETQAPTEAPKTEAPATEAPVEEGGCGGIIGGAVVVVAAVAAIGAGIAFKKKED